MSGLPTGWAERDLASLGVEVRGNTTLKAGTTYELYSVPAFADGLPEVVDGSDIKSGKRPVQPGDLLVCKINPRINRVWIVGEPRDSRNQVASTEYLVLRMPESEPDFTRRFVMWYLRSPRFRSWIKLNVEGATGSHTRAKSPAVLRQKVPVAPLDEQQRIVETIEEQFSRLDAGVDSLHRAKRNLARLRAAVLKAAVEGRLVPQRSTDGSASELLAELSSLRRQVWEHNHPEKQYKEPRSPDVRESGMDLSSGWAMVSVEQVSSRIEYGTSAKASPDVPGGVPVLRMGNIVDGSLSLDDLKYLPPDHLDVARFSLAAGDLMFNRTNSAELVGKSAVFGESDPPALFASYLIRVRFLSGVDPRYVAHVINSPYGRAHLARVRSQQVGQANVNGSKLAAFPVPLPPAAEQVRIVAEIERQFSVIDALEGALDSACIRAAGLRRSTLRDAFAGRLVSNRLVLKVADA